MKKRVLCVFMAVIAVITLFAGCNDNQNAEETNPTNPTTAATTGLSGEGGLDITEETTTRKPVSDEKLIAVTFDDGPHHTYTNRVLDTLARNNASATFFVVGYNIESNVETIKRILDSGNEVANHSASHKMLTKISSDEIARQVSGPNEMIKSLVGTEIELFRAPGGNFKGVTDKIGMPLIQWSIDTEDWKFKDAAHKGRTEEERSADLNRIADRVIEEAEKGDIILMHDIYAFTADLCDLIIPGLVEKGFRVVSVSEMYEAYGKELEAGKVYYSIDFSAENDKVIEPGNYRVKTKGSPLNIRIEPEAGTQSLAKVPNGTPLTVTECKPGWAKVLYEDVTGWVNTAYLEAIE